jgi:hypothetical protein
MYSQRKKTFTRLHSNKSSTRHQKRLKQPVADRRSGVDRRQSPDSHYFLKGGLERRSWKERRLLWYMTD